MTQSIAEKISELRRARRLTQEKLGELLGVSSQAVSKWENADSMPDIMLIPSICEILGISADALLEVPTAVKTKNCMEQVAAYAREAGACRAAYEAVCAGSYLAEQKGGTAEMSASGVKIHNCDGLAVRVQREPQAVERALFLLLKHGICECDADGKYTLGAKAYMLLAILAGYYIASPDGFRDIGNLTCSYTSK